MTITQILSELAPHRPALSQATLYGYLRKLKIKPLGRVRQCPQRYPDNTPTRLKKYLGISANGRKH